MRWPGTVSVPKPVFEAVLEAAARSLRQHGFTLVAFLGDSGLNQKSQERVAKKLAKHWGVPSVLHAGDYYLVNGQEAWLLSEGETKATIGTHAAIRDTSELMAADPSGIRPALIRADPPASSGSDGDPTRASAERGEKLLQLKVDAAVKQIRAAR